MGNEDSGGRSPETFVCEVCNEPKSTPRALAVHLERHRPVHPPIVDPNTQKEVSHPCNAGCGRNFGMLSDFRDHSILCDGQPPLAAVDERSLPSRTHTGGQLSCPNCRDDVPFENHNALAIHLERHREVLQKVVDGKTGETISKECPKGCGRNFLSKRDYKDHVTLCSGEPPLSNSSITEPPEPQKITPQQRDQAKRLDEYVLQTEGEASMGKGFRCPECSQNFKRPNTLGIHRKYKHGVKSGRDKGERRVAAPAKKEKPRPDAEFDRSGAKGVSGDKGIHGPEGHKNGSIAATLRARVEELRKEADDLEARVPELRKKADRLEGMIPDLEELF